MNQLNNNQLETLKGATGTLAKADSSSLRPLVSNTEDDKMKIPANNVIRKNLENSIDAGQAFKIQELMDILNSFPSLLNFNKTFNFPNNLLELDDAIEDLRNKLIKLTRSN